MGPGLWRGPRRQACWVGRDSRINGTPKARPREARMRSTVRTIAFRLSRVPPGGVFVNGARNRSISLGIGQIVADEAADQPDRATRE